MTRSPNARLLETTAVLWTLLLLVSGAAQAEGPVDKPLELLFTGDVSFAGRVLRTGRAFEDQNPLRAFGDRFAQADLAVANGEGLLTRERPPEYGEARLNIGAAPAWAKVYAAAGIDLVGLANNHSWDGGAPGVPENRKALVDAGVAVYGAGPTREEAEAPYVIRGKNGGCRVALVPATLKSNRPPRAGPSVAYYSGESGLLSLSERIRTLRKDGCFVIVSVHWGREGVNDPPAPVIAAGHALVDAGAAVVVGHHPHVLQGVEFRGGGVIAYSLGNFVFTNRDVEKRRTGVLSIRLSSGPTPTLAELALLPAVIDPLDFAPRPATDAQRADLRRRLEAYSKRFRTVVTEVADRIVFSGPPEP